MKRKPKPTTAPSGAAGDTLNDKERRAEFGRMIDNLESRLQNEDSEWLSVRAFAEDMLLQNQGNGAFPRETVYRLIVHALDGSIRARMLAKDIRELDPLF